ncbi:MAG: VRR-NUC domain-containing protein [Prevotella sp.]|nr:VRR-NUC domain-containing protein [Prevotella sp.]
MKKYIANIVNHAAVSEKSIERYLCFRCTVHGGVCLKYSNPNQAGYPDRVMLLPNGRTIWVELKSMGEKPRRLQVERMKKLASLGHEVHVCDSKQSVDEIFNGL